MHVYETEIKFSQNNCGGLPAKMSTNNLAGMHMPLADGEVESGSPFFESGWVL